MWARMESNHPPPFYQKGVLPLNYVPITTIELTFTLIYYQNSEQKSKIRTSIRRNKEGLSGKDLGF